MDLILTDGLIIVFLIALSAFFSGSETGLTASSSASIHKLKQSGNKRAAQVSQLREDKDKLIGAILLGNNAVNIFASALATQLAISTMGDGAVVIVTVIMTLVVLIFAEVLPKTYAFHHAEKLSLAIAPIMFWFVKLVQPITVMIQTVVQGIMFILGISKNVESIITATDELRGAIDLHHEEGGVVKQDRDMLSSILDLERIDVAEVMVHRKNMFGIDRDQAVSEIVAQMLDSTYTRVPIWKDKPENVVGLLHVKALLLALRKHHDDIEQFDIDAIISKPWFVPETNSLNNQLMQFRQKKTHLAFVINEYGDLVGLVTLEDVLEEIVGQIEDEHDSDEEEIECLGGDLYRVKGEMTVRHINRHLGWNVAEEHAATIAGYIIHRLERIPEQEETFDIDGIRFVISEKEQNQIIWIKMEKV